MDRILGKMRKGGEEVRRKEVRRCEVKGGLKKLSCPS
jgi:hypothetical protein